MRTSQTRSRDLLAQDFCALIDSGMLCRLLCFRDPKHLLEQYASWSDCGREILLIESNKDNLTHQRYTVGAYVMTMY